MIPPGAPICRHCRQDIQWRRHLDTGRPAPLDPRPSEDGNCLLIEPDLYVVHGPADLARLTPDTPRYKNHFATCPNLPSRS